MTDIDVLYTPFNIGRLKLKNRFVQVAMHTRFASEFGEASDKLTSYLVERARGGVSMIILENTAVDWAEGRAAGNPIRIDEDVFVSGLSDMTEAVHREGVFIASQLHHAGRQNPTSNTEGHVGSVAPSAIASTAIGDEPRALTTEQIQVIIGQFAAAARRSVTAGFDMVEIHGSHGYLLTQFLSPQSNLRTDEYGGSFENRARFPLEVVRAVREAVGPNFPVSYRISLEERTPGGMDSDEGVAFCKMIDEYVDVFNVTAGTYESMDTIFTMQGVTPGSLLPLAAKLKPHVSKPVIGVSRLGWDLDKAAESVASGDLDLVALGRTQLTDPDLVTKMKNGDGGRVVPCIACNTCVAGFLFNDWRVRCVVNPELGYEGQLPTLLQLSMRPRNVVVVGGGPAGFEAARVAAKRGHKVTLYEAGPSLGGQARTAARSPLSALEMEAYCLYFQEELKHLGVTVHLNSRIDASHSALKGVDDLVLATGGCPATEPPESAVDAVSALNGEFPAGDVVVLGANVAGLHASAVAVQGGAQAWVVVGKAKRPGYDVNPMLSEHLHKILVNSGVKFVDEEPSVEATRIWSPDWTADESDWDVPAGVNVVSVGNRVQRGHLYQATQSGFWAGTRI